VKKGILRESDNDRDLNSSNPIYSLPTIPKGKVMMFTSNKDKEIKEIKINDKNIKVQYEDDISLGRVRIQLMKK